ncbi:hypothetical protein, partial [Bathymodiolus thermophilus thioautotrophic gill symbiont]|uniref:hypothetical protein n=1 Tax=Bathymodiolus thermophilus thioautotrophic gill symbiont TaxID=2360 RepID=UPI00111618EC
MNIFNRFIITTLLVLSTSQVLALNTIGIANTPLVPAQSRVEAFASFNGLAITAKKKLGVNGNGLKLMVEENHRDDNAGLNTDGCVKDSERSFADKTSILILCGTGFTGGISYTSELAIVINSLEYFSSSAGSSTRRPDLGNGGTDIVLSGGKDAAPAQAQVTTFTPTSANSTKTYIITINNTLYTTQANASTPIKAIVEALQAKVTANTAITCTEDDSKITCTANTADTAFTYASSVDDSLVITTSNLTIPEETQTVATLTTNKDGTTFSLDGTADNNNLFKIENNVLKFKDSNGIDFDTAQPKVYTIHLKASKNGETDVTKTITITLTDTNDNPPTDITLSNSTLIIVEGVNYFDNDPNHLFLVANLGAIDVDTTNTFTFSLENNTGNFFKIVDGTKLRII